MPPKFNFQKEFIKTQSIRNYAYTANLVSAGSSSQYITNGLLQPGTINPTTSTLITQAANGTFSNYVVDARELGRFSNDSSPIFTTGPTVVEATEIATIRTMNHAYMDENSEIIYSQPAPGVGPIQLQAAATEKTRIEQIVVTNAAVEPVQQGKSVAEIAQIQQTALQNHRVRVQDIPATHIEINDPFKNLSLGVWLSNKFHSDILDREILKSLQIVLNCQIDLLKVQ